MKIGDAVKISSHLPESFGVDGIGFVVTKPYACVIQDGKNTVETKVTDVLFGTEILEKIPLDCLQIIF